jgi:hypothetical protein
MLRKISATHRSESLALQDRGDFASKVAGSVHRPGHLFGNQQQ